MCYICSTLLSLCTKVHPTRMTPLLHFPSLYNTCVRSFSSIHLCLKACVSNLLTCVRRFLEIPWGWSHAVKKGISTYKVSPDVCFIFLGSWKGHTMCNLSLPLDKGRRCLIPFIRLLSTHPGTNKLLDAAAIWLIGISFVDLPVSHHAIYFPIHSCLCFFNCSNLNITILLAGEPMF